MPFVPTEKQRESLNYLIKRFINENTQIRVVRFMNFSKYVQDNVIEVFCIELDDKYYIYHDGIIDTKLR